MIITIIFQFNSGFAAGAAAAGGKAGAAGAAGKLMIIYNQLNNIFLVTQLTVICSCPLPQVLAKRVEHGESLVAKLAVVEDLEVMASKSLNSPTATSTTINTTTTTTTTTTTAITIVQSQRFDGAALSYDNTCNDENLKKMAKIMKITSKQKDTFELFFSPFTILIITLDKL